LPIEKVTQGDDATSVKFYDTIDGTMKDLGFSSTGPDARKKFGQEDILSSATMVGVCVCVCVCMSNIYC
jgi:hypothetical protein